MSGTADEVLDGRYRLLDPVGTGGMAVVWRARDEVLGRDVAIKLLAAQLAANPSSRERIRSEAQAIARLSHPNITAVHDYGEAPGDDGLRPYVVMELLRGQLLSTRLRAGPMSWRQATQVCAQVAAALAAAHDRGVVHRDIKPTNVMLTHAGAKVLDFGVAGLAGSSDGDEDGTVFGTPAYLAPERLVGGVVVAATDVYTLGLLLYRCLTDRLPWDADSPTQMIANHAYEPPQPLPAIPGLPGPVVHLVTRCLAKDPERRPSATQAATILAAATGIHVVLPDSDGSSTQDVRVPDGLPTVRRSRKYREKRTMVAVAAVAVLTAAGVSVGLTVWQPWVSPGPCRVDFFIRPEGAGVITARLTVVNQGHRTRVPWRVSFVFPGGQRIRSSEGARPAQKGNQVTLTGNRALPSGKAVTAGLTAGGGRRIPPQNFTLNGTLCLHQVVERQPFDGVLPPVTGVTDPPPEPVDPGRPPPRDGPGGPGGPYGSDGPGGPGRPPPGGSPPARRAVLPTRRAGLPGGRAGLPGGRDGPVARRPRRRVRCA